MKTVAFTTLILAACATEAPFDANAVDAYLMSLGHLPSEASSRVDGAPVTSTEPNLACVTQPTSETRQHDRVVALAANSESLWAGALVRGDAVYSGLFTPISIDRAPMRMSISLSGLQGMQAATLESPTLSQYREALAGLLHQSVTGSTPANMTVDITKLEAADQLDLALGAGATWNGLVQIKGSFDWKSQTKKSRYLVKFVQSYYTVDVDAPGRASDVFAPHVTQDDITAVAGPGNPPVYVSSITYGRTVIFSFESDANDSELGAALEAVYKGPGAASGMISATTRNTLAQSRMSAYVLGGSGAAAAAAIDNADALIALIRTGGDYSPDSPGAPIAYKLAHLADNVPARLSFTSDYSVKTCSPTAGQVIVTLEAFTLVGSAQELDGDIELFGNVTVATSGGATSSLFSRARASSIVIGADETVPPTGFIGEQILTVSTTGGSAPITIRADLWDADSANNIDPDDSLGLTTFTYDLAGGWTRSFDVNLTGSGPRVLLRVSTRPM